MKLTLTGTDEAAEGLIKLARLELIVSAQPDILLLGADKVLKWIKMNIKNKKLLVVGILLLLIIIFSLLNTLG